MIYTSEQDAMTIDSLKMLAEYKKQKGDIKGAIEINRQMLVILNKSAVSALRDRNFQPDETIVYSDISAPPDPNHQTVDITIHLVIGSPFYERLLKVLPDLLQKDVEQGARERLKNNDN